MKCIISWTFAARIPIYAIGSDLVKYFFHPRVKFTSYIHWFETRKLTRDNKKTECYFYLKWNHKNLRWICSYWSSTICTVIAKKEDNQSPSSRSLRQMLRPLLKSCQQLHYSALKKRNDYASEKSEKKREAVIGCKDQEELSRQNPVGGSGVYCTSHFQGHQIRPSSSRLLGLMFCGRSD